MTRLAGSSKLLRAMNESAALALLLSRGTLTRAELRELTGLSKPTTSDVLRTLSDTGLAIVMGHASTGGPGPNAEIYAVNPAAAYVVAISVRDSTETPRAALAAALTDLTGEVLARAEYAAIADDPVQTVAFTVADLCRRAEIPAERITHVQIGVPGSYDPGDDTIRLIDVTGWGKPGLVTEMAGRLAEGQPGPNSTVTVGVDNDVNLAAIAERHRGVAAGSGSFALLWFGFGLGLAIDLGDTLLRGASGGAGEIGYVPVGLRGPELQDLVGGPAVVALAGEHGITASTAEEAVAQAIADGAQDFLEALAERIALGTAAVAAILDPPLVVLAGEVAQAGGAKLRDLVIAALHRDTPLRTPVEVTALTDDAVLLGALDAGLRTVRESLIDSLRHSLTPA